MLKRCRLLFEESWLEVVPAFAVAAMALVLYLRTIAPGIVGGDAGELQFVPYILSLTHPMGYPLHTLLGRLWATVVPLGSVAYRMNLLSVVAAAAAVGLVYGAVRLSTGSRFAGFGAGLLLGVSRLFWEQALTADKYALTAFVTALLLFVLAWWSQAPGRRDLRWCAIVYGLSLTEHRSMLVFFPVLIGYCVWLDRRLLRDWRYAGRAALFMLAPLALYLWLPIGLSRHLPPDSWHMVSLQGWWSYLTDQGHLAQMNLIANLGPKLVFYTKTLLEQFSPYGVALGLVGALHQARTRERLGVFVGLGFVLQAVLSTSNEVPRHWVYFLPSFVLYAFWLGHGFAWLQSTAVALVKRSESVGYGLAGLTVLLACALTGLSLQHNYAPFREAHLDGGPLDIWRQVLKSGYLAQRFATSSMEVVEADSIIVCDWEQATPLWYLQQVEGQRPDVSIFYPIDRWLEALATGRPTYLARTLPGVGEPYHLTAAGPLVRVKTKPVLELPGGVTPAAIQWEDQLELVGYRYGRTDFAAGYVLPVSLYFRATQALGTDYSISLRLWREDGVQVWAEDRQHPVLGMYPTSRWLPGEIVGDYFEVPFPRTLAAGRYRLGVILYTALDDGSWRNLTLPGDEVGIGYLPAFDVPPRP